MNQHSNFLFPTYPQPMNIQERIQLKRKKNRHRKPSREIISSKSLIQYNRSKCNLQLELLGLLPLFLKQRVTRVCLIGISIEQRLSQVCKLIAVMKIQLRFKILTEQKTVLETLSSQKILMSKREATEKSHKSLSQMMNL